MAMGRATKEIKKRLREAGYKKNKVWVDGYAPAWIHIKLTDRDKMTRCEMREMITTVFGKEQAEESYPVPSGNRQIGISRISKNDMFYTHHVILELEAEMIFGWREKKLYCSCGAIYELDQEEKYNTCQLLH